MADQQDTSIPVMDDRELFQSAVTDEAPARDEKPVTDAAPEAPVEQPRDEMGRFAPKSPERAAEAVPETAPQTPQPTEPTKDEQDGQVPSWRLREVREAREAAERRAEEASRQAYAMQQQMAALQRQLAELQRPQAQEPVDFFENPDAALYQRVAPLHQRFQQLETQVRLNTSRAVAIAMHGAGAVQEMEAAVEKATRQNHPDLPLLAAQMRASDDPVAVAMQWHKRTKLVEATGGDIDAYKSKVLDEAMKDPTFQAKVLEAARQQAGAAPQQSRPNIQLPPSLSRAPGSGVTQSELDDNDMSDRALFRHAMSAPRR